MAERIYFHPKLGCISQKKIPEKGDSYFGGGQPNLSLNT
jgi:hypothetical protein